MKLALFLFPLILVASQALADSEKPCRADILKFCKGVIPGGGAIIKCMKEHEAELSPECKTRYAESEEKREERRAEHAEKMKAGREACKGDVEKFCKKAPIGEGRIAKCLREHEAELSAGCKSNLPTGERKK